MIYYFYFLKSDLFIDAVVQSGSNPSLMLMKQLIETEQINGARAVLAVGALGFYAKTPTRQIFQQLLVNTHFA